MIAEPRNFQASSHKSLIRKGLVVTFLGGFLFTFDLPLLRLAAQAGGDTWTLIFARGLLMFISIFSVWFVFRRSEDGWRQFLGGFAGLGVIIANTLAPITYVNAVQLTGAANVVFILALIPLVTAVFSLVFLKEPIHPWTWTAGVISAAGVFVIVGSSLTFSLDWFLGDILALVSCICTAASFTIIRASGRNLVTSLAVGSLCSALVALFAGGAAPLAMPMECWMWIGLGGLVIIPAATALLAHGPRYLPSVDVSMFFLLETTITPLWTFLLFNEIPGRSVLVGGVIVIATLLLHSLWRVSAAVGSMERRAQ